MRLTRIFTQIKNSKTNQFKDYAQYDMNLFTEEEKRAYLDAHFAEDLEKARDLGKRLAEMALEIEKTGQY